MLQWRESCVRLDLSFLRRLANHLLHTIEAVIVLVEQGEQLLTDFASERFLAGGVAAEHESDKPTCDDESMDVLRLHRFRYDG